jgi:hypothetical protein
MDRECPHRASVPLKEVLQVCFGGFLSQRKDINPAIQTLTLVLSCSWTDATWTQLDPPFVGKSTRSLS